MPHLPQPQMILVPGAFAGAWMWADVAQLLHEQGIAMRTLELPTYGEHSHAEDFGSDVRAVRAALDDLDSPVVLVAHSYGGAVITAAAAGPCRTVRELVYVAGAAPGSGESMASVSSAAAQAAGQSPDGPGPAPREDGLLVFPPDVARQALFNDCTPERAQQGLDALRPQNLAGTDQTIETAAWEQLPAVYIRGEQDLVPRALSDGFLEQCVAVIDVPTGHCPQWSRPELVAEILGRRAHAHT